MCGFDPHSSPKVFFLGKKSQDLYTSATVMFIEELDLMAIVYLAESHSDSMVTARGVP